LASERTSGRVSGARAFGSVRPKETIRDDQTKAPTRITSPAVRTFVHVPALDGVRAVAVGSILVFHTSALRFLYPQWLPGGHYGVDLFFVLSGFLITSILLRERNDTGGIRIGAFYGRRFLRLIPALLFVLAVHFVVVLLEHDNVRVELQTVASAVFYYFNWRVVLGIPGNNDLGQLWSLSIEEQFYFVWPVVLVGLMALRARLRFVVTFLCLLIVVVAVRRWTMLDAGVSSFVVDVRTDTRVDALLIGCLASVLWTYGKVPRRGLPVAGTIGAIVIGLLFWFKEPTPMSYEGLRQLFAISTAVVLLAVVDGRWFGNRVLALTPLRAIGRISYALYLWHFPVYWWVSRHVPEPHRTPVVLLAVGLSFAMATISYFLVERPALRLKARLEPRRRSRPTIDLTDTAEPDAADRSREPAGTAVTPDLSSTSDRSGG
jgi:peptidoglycan/LPS O-acetylase OafA/YrhL